MLISLNSPGEAHAISRRPHGLLSAKPVIGAMQALASDSSPHFTLPSVLIRWYALPGFPSEDYRRRVKHGRARVFPRSLVGFVAFPPHMEALDSRRSVVRDRLDAKLEAQHGTANDKSRRLDQLNTRWSSGTDWGGKRQRSGHGQARSISSFLLLYDS